MADVPKMDARDPDRLSKIFRYFGEVETPKLNSRVYTDYSLGVAEDASLLALAAEIDDHQPAPNVLYASVQDLLLEDPAASPEARALAVFYPAITGGSIPDRSAWDAFRSFCLAHANQLKPRLRAGKTQTCVVHRCAIVLPALAALPRVEAARGRVALLEIGPSAGLNLRLDCYRYDYGNGLGWGAENVRPRLVCERRGERTLPLPGDLHVVTRRGLDLNPIDLKNPNSLRWQRALIWPEHAERARVMDEALAHAAKVPIEIEGGDATLEIAEHVARLPKDAARVVFATHVFYQIPAEGREAIRDGIASASREHPVDLIVMDSSGEGDSRITWYAFEAGERAGITTLARSDSHGRWIDWGAQ